MTLDDTSTPPDAVPAPDAGPDALSSPTGPQQPPATRPPLEKTVHIEASIETVWKAISEGKEMARWFPLDARITPGRGSGAAGASAADASAADPNAPGADAPDPGKIWLSFGPGMEGEAPLAAFEVNRRLGWVEDHGGGRRMSVDFHLEPTEGGTVVRLVQSGFGPEASWDDYYDGVDGGWSFFLLNLKHYVELHWATERTCVWRRHKVSGSREEVWTRLFSPEGLGEASAHTKPVGGAVAPRLGGLDLPGTIALNRPFRHFASTVPGRNDGLFFVEMEGEGEAWHLGIWISLYGAAQEGADDIGAALGETLDRLFPATK